MEHGGYVYPKRPFNYFIYISTKTDYAPNARSEEPLNFHQYKTKFEITTIVSNLSLRLPETKFENFPAYHQTFRQCETVRTGN